MERNTTSGFARFRRNRLATASLAILAAMYAASIVSELVCNSRPLVARSERGTFFPFLRHVSENDLFGNGVHSEPDWKSAATNGAVRAVFAPFRFGPRDIETAAAVEPYRRLRAVLTPSVRTGRLDLRPDLSIARHEGADAFFQPVPSSGSTLADAIAVPEGLAAAIGDRFANKACPEAVFVVTTPDSGEIEFSLSAYEPRTSPPRTVRVRLRDAQAARAAPISLLFNADGAPARSSRKAFSRLDAETRQAILEAVTPGGAGQIIDNRYEIIDNRYSAGITSSTLQLAAPGGASTYSTLSVSRETVTWPFRPVPGHPMGIDGAGRDVFARILYGTRTAMTFGLLLVGWAILLGIVAGALQGYFGGWVDLAGQRFIEIWSALPFLYVMILVGSVMGRSFALLLFCYGLFNWIGVSYYARAEFLRLRNRPFVEAAKCQGLSTWRIILRHILPNAMTPVITLLPFNLVGAISSISALDFLGFGLPPLTPSWGELLQQAQQNTSAWWLILYPSLFLFATMLLSVFVGEGLREALDPRPGTRYR